MLFPYYFYLKKGDLLVSFCPVSSKLVWTNCCNAFQSDCLGRAISHRQCGAKTQMLTMRDIGIDD